MHSNHSRGVKGSASKHYRRRKALCMYQMPKRRGPTCRRRDYSHISLVITQELSAATLFMMRCRGRSMCVGHFVVRLLQPPGKDKPHQRPFRPTNIRKQVCECQIRNVQSAVCRRESPVISSIIDSMLWLHVCMFARRAHRRPACFLHVSTILILVRLHYRRVQEPSVGRRRPIFSLPMDN